MKGKSKDGWKFDPSRYRGVREDWMAPGWADHWRPGEINLVWDSPKILALCKAQGQEIVRLRSALNAIHKTARVAVEGGEG